MYVVRNDKASEIARAFYKGKDCMIFYFVRE